MFIVEYTIAKEKFKAVVKGERSLEIAEKLSKFHDAKVMLVSVKEVPQVFPLPVAQDIGNFF